MNAPRHVSYDETVVEILKADSAFASEYLAAAQKEVNYPAYKLHCWRRFAILQRRKAEPFLLQLDPPRNWAQKSDTFADLLGLFT